MDLKEVKQLIKIVENSNISEIEIEEEGKKLRITKTFPSKNGETVVFPSFQQTLPAMAPQPAPAAAPQPAAPAEDAAAVTETPRKDNIVEVRSPMVGTFYRAPSPDADPYVEIGQTVAVGQTLCIIEAMKLMNEIESEVAGKVVDILVENAQPVEFNQVLFLIEKA
ncbi:MAG: acetyl-CoA carboxylase biotin carboxyl carrier protein [Calditrichaeota bacterium]|nr:acetyl-CoA carboxylase biotin carboxyl carrier protein [Calditrichota bacterium]